MNSYPPDFFIAELIAKYHTCSTEEQKICRANYIEARQVALDKNLGGAERDEWIKKRDCWACKLIASVQYENSYRIN